MTPETEVRPAEPAEPARTLWQIGGDIEALQSLIYEIGGDVSDEAVEAAIDAWLAETHDAEDAKLDRYGYLIRATEARAAFRAAEAKRLVDLSRTDGNFVSRLKDRLIAYFDAHGKTRHQTPRFAFAVAGNGGLQALHVREDATPLVDIPAEHTETTLVFRGASAEARAAAIAAAEKAGARSVSFETRPCTARIREALEAGMELPYAELLPRGRSMRIR